MLKLDARYYVVLIITITGTSHSQHYKVSSSYYSCQHSLATLRPSARKPQVSIYSDMNNHRTRRDISLKMTMYCCS